MKSQLAWAEGFLAYLNGECHLSKNTVLAYGRDLIKFYAWLGNRDISKLKIRDLSTYPQFLHEQNLSPISIARHLVSLRMFYKYLQLEQIVKDNQAQLLGSQKLWEHIPRVLSPVEVERLLAAPQPNAPCFLRDRAILETLYATGCRASELITIRMRDILWDEGFIRVIGKGDKERMVPFGVRAAQAVKTYIEQQTGRRFCFLSRQAAEKRSNLGADKKICSHGWHKKRNQPPLLASFLCNAPVG